MLSQRVVLSSPSPHPVTDRATLQLHVGRTQHVRADVFDVLGRHVSVLLDDVVASSTVRMLYVNAGRLPPGLYTVRVTAEDGLAAQSLIVLH